MSRKVEVLFLPLVFVLFFLYEIFFFKPFLLYSQFEPAFYFDYHFLRAFLDYPGGVAELISLFIFQFFANNLAAAILLSLLFLGCYLAVQSLFAALFSRRVPVPVVLLPLVVMMMFYNAYNVPLVIAVKFLLVVSIARFYCSNNTIRRVVLLAFLPIFYLVLGGWFSIMLVALLFSLHLAAPWRLSTLLWPLLFAGLFVITAFIAARYLYFISLREAFIYVLPFAFFHEPISFHMSWLFYIMSFILPVLVLLWRIVEIILEKYELKRTSISLRLFALNASVAILLFAAAMMVTRQQEQQRKIYINFLAQEAQWKEVLSESKKVHHYDRIVEFQTNRAMFFTGCLLDSLFYIDHPIGVNGLFLERIMMSQIAMHASDLYFDLGHINAAQVMAYEYQTKFRYSPRVLKRLALTNAINGHYAKAEKFINLLQKSPVHKTWAKDHMVLLDESLAGTLPVVAVNRLLQPQRDFFLHATSPNSDMAALLESNEANRMAFEYLMAYYLLECKMGNIADRISWLNKYDYAIAPQHIEEAAIMYQAGAKSTGLEPITDFRFHRDRIARFADFNKIMLTYKTTQQRKTQLVQRGYGNTFWYYLFDGGGTRTEKMKKVRVEGGY